MACIPDQIIYKTKSSGWVKLSIDDYEYLRDIERKMEALKNNPDYIIISHGYDGPIKVTPSSESIRMVMEDRKLTQQWYEELKEKKVPMLNKPGKKVKDL